MEILVNTRFYFILVTLIFCVSVIGRPSAVHIIDYSSACNITDEHLGIIFCCFNTTGVPNSSLYCVSLLPRNSFDMLQLSTHQVVDNANSIILHYQNRGGSTQEVGVPIKFRQIETEPLFEAVINKINKKIFCCLENKELVILEKGVSANEEVYEVYQEHPNAVQVVMNRTCLSDNCTYEGVDCKCHQGWALLPQYVIDDQYPEYLRMEPIRVGKGCICEPQNVRIQFPPFSPDGDYISMKNYSRKFKRLAKDEIGIEYNSTFGNSAEYPHHNSTYYGVIMNLLRNLIKRLHGTFSINSQDPSTLKQKEETWEKAAKLIISATEVLEINREPTPDKINVARADNISNINPVNQIDDYFRINESTTFETPSSTNNKETNRFFESNTYLPEDLDYEPSFVENKTGTRNSITYVSVPGVTNYTEINLSTTINYANADFDSNLMNLITPELDLETQSNTTKEMDNIENTTTVIESENEATNAPVRNYMTVNETLDHFQVTNEITKTTVSDINEQTGVSVTDIINETGENFMVSTDGKDNLNDETTTLRHIETIESVTTDANWDENILDGLERFDFDSIFENFHENITDSITKKQDLTNASEYSFMNPIALSQVNTSVIFESIETDLDFKNITSIRTTEYIDYNNIDDALNGSTGINFKDYYSSGNLEDSTTPMVLHPSTFNDFESIEIMNMKLEENGTGIDVDLTNSIKRVGLEDTHQNGEFLSEMGEKKNKTDYSFKPTNGNNSDKYQYSDYTNESLSLNRKENILDEKTNQENRDDSSIKDDMQKPKNVESFLLDKYWNNSFAGKLIPPTTGLPNRNTTVKNENMVGGNSWLDNQEINLFIENSSTVIADWKDKQTIRDDEYAALNRSKDSKIVRDINELKSSVSYEDSSRGIKENFNPASTDKTSSYEIDKDFYVASTTAGIMDSERTYLEHNIEISITEKHFEAEEAKITNSYNTESLLINEPINLKNRSLGRSEILTFPNNLEETDETLTERTPLYVGKTTLVIPNSNISEKVYLLEHGMDHTDKSVFIKDNKNKTHSFSNSSIKFKTVLEAENKYVEFCPSPKVLDRCCQCCANNPLLKELLEICKINKDRNKRLIHYLDSVLMEKLNNSEIYDFLNLIISNIPEEEQQLFYLKKANDLFSVEVVPELGTANTENVTEFVIANTENVSELGAANTENVTELNNANTEFVTVYTEIVTEFVAANAENVSELGTGNTENEAELGNGNTENVAELSNANTEFVTAYTEIVTELDTVNIEIVTELSTANTEAVTELGVGNLKGVTDLVNNTEVFT